LTDGKHHKRRKLVWEILGILVLTAAISLLLFGILRIFGIMIADRYLLHESTVLSDEELNILEGRIIVLSGAVSAVFFSFLFVFLTGERLSYIMEIIDGIEAMQNGSEDHIVPEEGNNELTQLAESINYLSAYRKRIRQKELKLNGEKELFIRSLSHDIRTPLTSIMAYSEYISSGGDKTEAAGLILKNAQKIKILTDILLDGGERSPELIENGKLLFTQLLSDLESELEDNFHIKCDLTDCGDFSGSFDIGELQRLTGNLISNIRKYADPAFPVEVAVSTDADAVILMQRNRIRKDQTPEESYKMGIDAMKRIAQNYFGSVVTSATEDTFEIRIMLSIK